jgi:hypothetical protein
MRRVEYARLVDSMRYGDWIYENQIRRLPHFWRLAAGEVSTKGIICCTDGASVDRRPPDLLVESGGLGRGPHRGDLRNFHARNSLTENTRSPSVSEISLRVIKHRIW